MHPLGVTNRRPGAGNHDVAFTQSKLFQSVVLNRAMRDGGPINELGHDVRDAKKLRPDFFLLGAGVGAVTTVALYAGQIRHLRGLEAATLDHSQALSRDHSVTERQGDTSVERKSA